MQDFTRRTVLAALAVAPFPAVAARTRTCRDDFAHGLDQWVAEAEQPARIVATGGVLDIEAPAGLTLWFRPILKAPATIRYEVQAVAAGGAHDRVSDANCFWMARDRQAPDGDMLARPRSGRFADYDTLETYYVGLGGNGNTTTRFRRYVGKVGDRPLLPGNDRRAAADLLVANRWQRIEIIADGSGTRFSRDGVLLFRYDDSAPLTSGRFGLRTTASHLRVRRFRVGASL